MEVSMVQPSDDPVEMHRNTEPKQSDTKDSVTKPHAPQLQEKPPVEGVKKAGKVLKPNVTTTPKSTVTGGASKRRIEAKSGGDSSSNEARPTLTKPTMSSASRTSGSVPVTRRSSTGGLPEKQPILITKRQSTDFGLAAGKRTSSLASEPLRKSLPEIRRTSVSSIGAKPAIRQSVPETRKSVPISPVAKTPRTPTSSDSSKQDSSKKTSLRSSQLSVSSVKKISSPSLDSTGSSSSIRKSISKVNSLSARSPTVSSGSKSGSMSTSLDRSSSLSGRKKVTTPESRDSRLIMLPQVEAKAGDDVRLDLRGHKIRSLTSSGLNLSQNLEFVYLRDNLLSTLDGVEVLKRVKVLDLSFNDFKGPGFEPLENCKALQQLYLAGNQITSLKSLPELPNLEFLSVAQNKLKSLSMASQPRLQVLAASKNKISTLKGFPYLPALEHLRVEENPILKVSHLEAASILLVGPTLKKFNDRDLSREEIAIAKRYPSHTALCIRGGWELCRPEQAVDSTFKFLLEQWKEQLPSGYLLKHASVDQPFEEDACCCHFEFVRDITEDSGSALDLKYEWFIGDRTPSNFTPISGACKEIYFPKNDDVGRILKVECTPILGDTEYPTIFAISSPVSPGTGIPKVMKIDVRGELVEGNTIKGYVDVAWCGGTPAKGVASWLRRRWNSSPVVIAGAEEEEYQLMLDDVDSCLVYMYTPVTEEGAKGEPQYAITDYVKAAPPSVADVQVTGDAVEGNTIRGIGKYFGGKEGPSTFEWLREDKDTGEFTLVLTGTNEYTLTKEDVGRRLTFVYIPVNFEGQEGKSMSVVSQTVKQAPPRVTNIKIIGELKEGSKVTVTGIVTGGTEASSRVQWFKTSSSTFEGENGLEALSTSKIAKAFRIPLGAVGKYIVAKFTPMTPDGEVGEPAYVISDTVVETLPPSLNFLSITGDYSEGGVLTASYGYIGGHEGKSIYNWYLHEVENDSGTIIPEVSGLLQYRVPKDAIGKFISFACTPVRNDGIAGEPRTCIGQERVRPGSPRLLSLQINGTATEGTTLNVEKKYWGGEEGESIYRWFRTSSNGTHSEISGATSSSYMLSVDDIGFFISVSCEPIRSDWARGPIVLSEQVGPIVPGPPTCRSLEFHGSLVEGTHLSFIASYSGGLKGDCLYEWFRVKGNGLREKLHVGEFLDLTFNEVGDCVELVYTPVRVDGMKGSPKTLVSHPVAPGDPLGVELVIPECCEGQEVVPEKRYFGGQEGAGKYIWFRAKDKLHEPALMELANNCENVDIRGQTLTHTPSVEDVGTYLALYWVPTRSDGKRGKPLVSICESPVIPAVPAVSSVCVKKLSSSTYYGEGEYFGGYEGASLFSWYRQSDDGKIVLIEGANSKTYEVSDEDYNYRLLFGYTPVRSDSVVGELRLSEPSDIILPELPRVEMLALTGKAVEGEVLTALEVIPKSENQQLVWGKYKKEVKYQWFFSSEPENEKSFEPFPSQRSCSYKVRFEDIGRYLRCECIVTDVFGRSSEPAYAETSSVLPGVPRMDKLEIEGRGFHTNLYAVRGVYSGGKEGKSRIQWLRSMVGSPDLISIPGETGRMYEANVDDVGYRLVAIYTPVRDDGVEGHPVSASTDPIAVEPDVHKEVKQKLDLGSVKFEALCDKDRSAKRVPGVGSLERRILEVNRKRVKVVKPGSKTSFPTTEIRGSYAPPFHVELFRNDQHRLRIVVDSENEVDLMVQTRHLRDVIVLVIRGLAQRFNSTSLNTLLKIEA
ncbi:microtubule-associated protein AIR9 [Sesamum alatum]|uniref:Microtubule-associated protein AIR9 n=1 Tax=Sesamum alatum TaxID=300844 RepID=A0AAE2CZX6_9LAMI|nr:microtubule-associated protein AIR9 [Sesamum alatum]